MADKDDPDGVNALRYAIREAAAKLAALRSRLAHIQRERYRSMVDAFDREIRAILQGAKEDTDG